ncbi:hypothetical protein IC214_05870 [Clostridioides sp. ES-S-0190-01]|nr:hypothetical protein [Clostridioides sp. ES-S-0001-02]MCC0656845.1 hypothetical protein [Clostridioides sp. ES-S-0123-01]MCC0681555.1 hypothetical protein [Clostridioides sp. ES-S-0005-03]MCC0706552.1 hypothetical protein [Clostridioides sp. ES-S-0190-01]UDN49357.1 hypothetical protein JJJ25_05010 [Clostridioides sp. ES-S-0173-01]
MYCLSVMLVIYGIYVFINCTEYIYTMLSTKQLAFTGNEYTIINYYMSNFSQYIIFAILLASMGFVIQKLGNMNFDKMGISGNYSTNIRNISDIFIDNSKDSEMFDKVSIENSILKNK